jgi:hypothetical protein
MEKLNGETTGPGLSSGPIGQAIVRDIINAPLVKFTPVSCQLLPLEEKIESDLSRDQALLRGYMLGIADGKISAQFARKLPG